MVEDEKIIEMFYERSEQAIAEVDIKYGKLCHRLSFNILNSWPDAEECVNDAYLGAWNAIPPAKPNPLQAYICKIVRNISLKRYYRKGAAKRNSTYDLAMEELKHQLSSPNTVETERVAAMYSGSGLAEARGWTKEYLAEHFVVVWAKYYVEYDHAKTFMDDGYTEQYFYLTQDTETGEWTISDNTSPNTHTAPPAPNAVWEYQPLLSSKRPAFPFHFNIFSPLSIEAECDNGTLIDYDNHDGTAYPHGKQLTLSSGSTLYWTPQTEGREDFALSAEITFTVYAGNDVLYTGSISIFGEKVEDSPTNAAYSATLGEGSGLTMEQAMEMNGKEVEGATITAPSHFDGLTSSDTRLLATVYVGRGRSRLSPRNMGCGQA